MKWGLDKELVDAFRKASTVTVITGAGMSAESGISTFRDPLDGVWSKYDPHELATMDAFKKNPKLVWDWYEYRRRNLGKAWLHPGHLALAKMSRLIKNFHLITQNVDGLHQRSGIRDVIELHGNIDYGRITETEEVIHSSRFSVREKNINYYRFFDDGPEEHPLTYMRPNVVWFGEPVDSEKLQEAKKYVSQADIVLVIGTSGLVRPAAALPALARDGSAIIVEINTEKSELTESVDYFFAGPVSYVLLKLLNSVWDTKFDACSADMYFDERYPTCTKTRLNAVAAFAALPTIHSVSVYPDKPEPVLRMLVDERAKRLTGSHGRVQSNFDVNIQADGCGFSGVNCYGEGINRGELSVVTDIDYVGLVGADKIILLLESLVLESELPKTCMWQRHDDYYVGYTEGLSDMPVTIDPRQVGNCKK